MLAWRAYDIACKFKEAVDINKKLAGQKHPKTKVPFDKKAQPDFSKHLYNGGKNKVKINPTGNKGHLLQFNGGRCAPSGFSFKEDGRIQESAIHFFLAINGNPYNDFLDYFQTYKTDAKRMPTTVFSIAYDHGGNQICWDTLDDKIYFWAHEIEIDYATTDDTNRPNLYFIANNLQSFLHNLTSSSLEQNSTPAGYTWHHHQDYGVMKLVETTIHNKTPHTGGWEIWGKHAKGKKNIADLNKEL